MKNLLANSALSVCLAMVLITAWLVTTPVSVYASGGWDGCQSSDGSWTPGDPGDKSGCSVRYNGEPVPGLGEYEYYNCSDPSKNATCFYNHFLM